MHVVYISKEGGQKRRILRNSYLKTLLLRVILFVCGNRRKGKQHQGLVCMIRAHVYGECGTMMQ